ncbi:hypothetical protein SKAU_G00122290 [Synaphobranchus kaupii]|uniref:Uncharacterized protein n=1 Tax=Synaphobranchus kaupii TaxID=118154 RepID=A0A9Q1FPL2_SYNKA|nr:hypothetical protein SKAU_G00122290 [Synaphobranchus kaupii]
MIRPRDSGQSGTGINRGFADGDRTGVVLPARSRPEKMADPQLDQRSCLWLGPMCSARQAKSFLRKWSVKHEQCCPAGEEMFIWGNFAGNVALESQQCCCGSGQLELPTVYKPQAVPRAPELQRGGAETGRQPCGLHWHMPRPLPNSLVPLLESGSALYQPEGLATVPSHCASVKGERPACRLRIRPLDSLGRAT